MKRILLIIAMLSLTSSYLHSSIVQDIANALKIPAQVVDIYGIEYFGEDKWPEIQKTLKSEASFLAHALTIDAFAVALVNYEMPIPLISMWLSGLYGLWECSYLAPEEYIQTFKEGKIMRGLQKCYNTLHYALDAAQIVPAAAGAINYFAHFYFHPHKPFVDKSSNQLSENLGMLAAIPVGLKMAFYLIEYMHYVISLDEDALLGLKED